MAEFGGDSVCAVIVTYNCGSGILGLVEALKHQVGHIFLADNDSNQASKQVLLSIADPRVTLVQNRSNFGLAHGLNQGVSFAADKNFTWILTLDQDSIPAPDMVDQLLNSARHFRSSPSVASFAPCLIRKGQRPKNANVQGSGFNDAYTVITSGNLVRLDAFAKAGMYSTGYFIDSLDFEFCLRLRKLGYRIIRCRHAYLFHEVGRQKTYRCFGLRITVPVHPPQRRYYIMRNHVLLTRTYLLRFPLYCLWKQLGMLLILTQIALLEDEFAANARYLRKGFLDGLRGVHGKLSPRRAEVALGDQSKA